MDRNWYQITLEPLSPFHIGFFKYGVIAETRLFLPGWTIWGAMVNALAKEENEYPIYQELFRAISCFYPVLVEKGRKNHLSEHSTVWIPSLEEGRFFFKKHVRHHDVTVGAKSDFAETNLILQEAISEEEFRSHFTDTYLSTAIVPDSLAAKDESLHEIEVLLPQSKMNPRYRLYWQGVLGLKEKENPLRKGQRLRVGGEARYGFGQMKICDIKSKKDGFLVWEIPQLQPEDGNNTESLKSLVHYMALDNNLNLNNADLQQHRTEQVILGLDFDKNSPEITEHQLCLIPGSKVRLDYAPNQFELDRGILKKIGNA